MIHILKAGLPALRKILEGAKTWKAHHELRSTQTTGQEKIRHEAELFFYNETIKELENLIKDAETI